MKPFRITVVNQHFFFAALDLSFNNIEVIEGLDQLTKLKDVTFFNNRITTICNMDALTELQIFSIGNNKLTNLTDVIYFPPVLFGFIRRKQV